MQLTGIEAVKKGIILQSKGGRTRPASYDLSVGKVYVQGEEKGSDVLIQPQQTFLIESLETVKVPAGFVGYAMPKTSLCNEGVLVLNTGLIDPGFEGALSTIAINFSLGANRIKRGAPFLRLVFHELGGDGSGKSDETLSSVDAAATKERSRQYPATFLDVPGRTAELIREVTADVVDRQRNAILLLISTIGFLFVLWNFGSYFLLTRQSNAIADRVTQANSRDVAGLEERVKILEGLVKASPRK